MSAYSKPWVGLKDDLRFVGSVNAMAKSADEFYHLKALVIPQNNDLQLPVVKATKTMLYM
jgi:hypothetical protein